MDSAYRNKLQQYLSARNWYPLLSHDVQRSIELADHLKLDVIPDRVRLNLHWVLTVGNGANGHVIDVVKNNNKYKIKIDDGNLNQIAHTSL